MRRILLSLALLPLLACAGSNVGATCTADGDCGGGGLTCQTAFPGGYCTTTCTTEGEQAECPGDALCTRGPLSEALVCAALCQTQADCREEYECNGVTGTNVKVCQPKL